jgi:hypothetical protein
MKRKTARRAYAPKKTTRRRARKNPTTREFTQVLVWGAGAALGGSYVKRYLGQVTGSPMAADWGTTAALAGLGWWLTMKAKTTPAGFAVLGIAMSHAAETVAANMGYMTESGQNFVNKSKIYRSLPKTVSIQAPNPIARIVVPA